MYLISVLNIKTYKGNILLNDTMKPWDLKVIDFGISIDNGENLIEENLKEVSGTRKYMAPE